MGFFDRFRQTRRTCDDPMFGHLEYKQSSWVGAILFPPTAEEVMVTIESDGAEPTEQHRAMFSELAERYASLGPAIGAALFTLWEPHISEWDDNPPIVTSADEMLKYTNLFSIELEAPSRISLGYSFKPEVGWDDAMFSLKLTNWEVAPESLDD